MVTHGMRFAREVWRLGDSLHQGKVHETGAPEEFFSRPKTPELQQFLGMVAA